MGPWSTVLLDLDGTLYVEGQWLPGAVEAVRDLIQMGVTLRFVTNTTMRPRRHLRERFARVGLDVPIEWFFTPALAARTFFQSRPLQYGILPLVHPALHEDLSGVPFAPDEKADYVLVGDMGDTWSITELNRALRCLLNGATLTALQKNRFWMARDGYRLDAGAFAAALEYGANTQCRLVFGKPNETFFKMILKDTRSRAEQTVMVGDDLEVDIFGAQKVGISGVLVQTGKSLHHDWGPDLKKADAVVGDITAFVEWFRAS